MTIATRQNASWLQRRGGIGLASGHDLILVTSFVLLILVSATQIRSFPPSAVEYTAQYGDGNAMRQGLYSLCLVGILIASRPLAIGWRIIAIPPEILLLLAVCAVSITWSASPGVAARRLVLTTMVLWMVFRSVDALGYRRALDIMAGTLVALLVINYAYVIFSPAGAIHQGGGIGDDEGLAGNWHGLVPHKNDTGPILAETIILLAFGFGRLTLALRLLSIAAAAYFLYQTHSKTSWGLVFVGLSVGVAALRYNAAYRALLIPAVMVTGVIAVYAASIYLPPALAALESSEQAFTGRIQIWRIMASYLNDHWVLGAGFGSFWDAGKVSPASIYGRGWVAEMVSQGHNGYLDLWTQIGIFGLLLAMAVLFVVPATRLLVTRDVPKTSAAALLGLLVFLAAHNMTETSLMTRDFFGNTMLAFVVAGIGNLCGATARGSVRSAQAGRRRTAPRPGSRAAPRVSKL